MSRLDFPDFQQERFRLQEVFRNLPTWAGNAALNFFKDSWRRGGFIDSRFERWPQRKSGQDGRGILVKTGALRRSLRLRVGKAWVEIYTSVPYAQAHNEGDTIVQTVTARQRRYFWAMHAKAKRMGTPDADLWRRMALSTTITIKMPKRQFMGHSKFLERRIVLHVERAIMNALK
jgi:phage gpG-like protein